MAEIVGGIGTSHIPGIGAAIDRDKTQEPLWKNLFDHYEPVREWLQELAPDVAIVVYNDHASAFSMQLIPTFALGVADRFLPADEGYGRRQVPTAAGSPELAWHLAERLILDGFDLTIANELDIDHGCTVPLSIGCGKPDQWPFAVIPLCVNVIQYPPPTGKRCHDLGAGIRRALSSWDGDERVVVFGTGGMSHQLQGERAGLVNADFDTAFLDGLTADPGQIAAIDHPTYLRDAGSEGIELVMWMVMRGALGDDVTETYRHYQVAAASNTAAGLIVLEPSG